MKLKVGLTVLLVIAISFGAYYFINNKSKDSNIAKEQVSAESSQLSLSFVGDVMLASNVENKIFNTTPYYPFENVKSILSSSDISMANLEFAISTLGRPKIKEFTFRANPLVMRGLKASGIDIFSIANNHILDYGHDALRETIQNLDSANLAHVGAGMNLKEALKPVIFNKKGKKIAYIGASRVIPATDWYASENGPGVAGAYDPQPLIEVVKEAHQSNDLTIVYLHWGKEREIIPNEQQKTLARQLIDNGADIVVGTHTHTLEGFEYYKGKLIAYSLGNFIFTNSKKETMILQVQLQDDNLIKANVIPAEIREFRPEILTDNVQKNNFYKMLEARSVNVRIETGEIIEK